MDLQFIQCLYAICNPKPESEVIVINDVEFLSQYFSINVDSDQIVLSKKSAVPYNKNDVVDAVTQLKKYKVNSLHLLENRSPNYRDVVGVDIETTALVPFNGDIRLIGIATHSGDIITDQVAEVAAILADTNVLKVFHNAVFDVAWLRAKGYEVNTYTDTLVMNQVIQNKANNGNSLQKLAKEYLNIFLDKSLQTPENWSAELTEAHKQYCLLDAQTALELYYALKTEIELKHLEVVLDRELRALDTVIELNNNGILFDYAGWNQELEKMKLDCESLGDQIRHMLGSPTLNLQSPIQIITALRNNGIEIEGTADEVLAKYENKLEVIGLLRRYKKLQKQRNSFGEKLLQFMGPDGRLRGMWRLIGTDTSRMTCSSPNLQGMPGISKKYFYAPSGCSLIAADYSTIELRILAQITKDPELLSAFAKGEDLHIKTARAVLGKTSDEDIGPEERKIGKVINFGLVYGMTSYGLRKKINAGKTHSITLEQASAFRNRYFDLYKNVLAYQDQMLKSNFIQTLGGRYWSTETTELEKGTIARFNYPVQASGAEGLKEALYLLQQSKNSDWKIVAVVHDEIVLEVPEQDVEAASALLKQCMVAGMSKILTSVPVEVDLNVSYYWAKN